MNKFIYVDNAATTKLSPKVLEAMQPYFLEEYGNPSSIYALGRRSKKAIEDARSEVASLIGAEPREIFFTSSGTESDNWAIFGAARRLIGKGKNHIITSAIEHHAVLHAVAALEKEGFEITYIPVNSEGKLRSLQLCTQTTRSAPFSLLKRLQKSAARKRCISIPMPFRRQPISR